MMFYDFYPVMIALRMTWRHTKNNLIAIWLASFESDCAPFPKPMS